MEDLFWSNLVVLVGLLAVTVLLASILWSVRHTASSPPNAEEIAEDKRRSNGAGVYFWKARWKALRDTGEWCR